MTALALAGCASAPQRSAPPAPPARTVAPRMHSPKVRVTRVRRVRVAAPARLRIPAIGVDTSLVALALDRAGTLEVPRRFDVAGWWSGGARPGERGPAVIAGHVDSQTGPAVFFGLGRLRRGDGVLVERRDGGLLRFTVRRVERYPKNRFPTARVYGPTRRPELRLITCSGAFDHLTGHYLDNTVVYARA